MYGAALNRQHVDPSTSSVRHLTPKEKTKWRILADRAHDPLELMQDDDAEKARRVTEAMLKMVKIDIAELQRAYDGS